MRENPRAALVEDFKERLERAKVAVIVEYKGLTVKKMEEFRRDLRVKGAQLKIIKNTLAKRALDECKLPAADDILKGQVAFIFGYDDAVGGPKAATLFSKDNEEFRIVAGIFEGELVGADVIEHLATVPSKDVLRAKLLMLLQAPQMQFLSLLKAVQQEFAGTIKALAEKKGESKPE